MSARCLCLRFVLGLALGGSVASAASALEQAKALYEGRHYVEAQAALVKLTAAEPNNAAACYYLGLTQWELPGADAKDQALPWLEKAVQLAPGNAAYLADLGGVSLEMAGRRRSLTLALQGRDCLEKAIAINPGDLASREGLLQFYGQAPWPLGDVAKARQHADEIATRDPRRGARAWAKLGGLLEKKSDSAGARAAYTAALRCDPENARAHEGLSRLGPNS